MGTARSHMHTGLGSATGTGMLFYFTIHGEKKKKKKATNIYTLFKAREGHLSPPSPLMKNTPDI